AVEVVELRARGHGQSGNAKHQQHPQPPLHGRHDSRRGSRARIAVALGGALLLAACGWTPGEWTPSAGFLGRQVNPRPEPVTLTASGGLHGELIAGNDQSPVPVELVDAVVGTELRRWLSPPERAALAEASQHAAVAESNAKVDWAAQPPDGAAGWASPISDPYRAGHGAICRD